MTAVARSIRGHILIPPGLAVIGLFVAFAAGIGLLQKQRINADISSCLDLTNRMFLSEIQPESDKRGTFSLRIVRPRVTEGQTVGSIELSREIGYFLPHLKTVPDSELLSDDCFFDAHSGTQMHQARLVPLLDVSGRGFGSILVLRDMIRRRNGLWGILIAIVMICGVIGAVVFGLCCVLNVRQQKRLIKTTDAILQALNKELQREHQEHVQSWKVSQQSRELAEHADKARQQFLAHVSHELRTPLNAIIGLSEQIAKSNSMGEIHSHAQTVLGQSEHLLSLIGGILDYAKIESGRTDLNYQPLDMVQLIQSVVDSVGIQARSKPLTLTSHIADDVPVYIIGDSLRLRQILMNFVDNAVKFTESGSVTITVENLVSDASVAELRFRIIDTGIGIAQDKQSLVFKPFRQVDGSSTRRYRGTGLGTHIAKELVEMMGGQIGLTSKPGQGSTFWFTIPCQVCDAPASDGFPKLDTCTHLAPLHVLVAEDHEPNQLVEKIILENAGHRVDLACDGQEAVEKCRTGHYDLILMDAQMPRMDGLKATRLIRSGQSSCRHIPIIGLTASADPDTLNACLKAGMNNVTTKPIRHKKLLDMIRICFGPSTEAPTAKPVEPLDTDTPDNPPGTAQSPLDFETILGEFGNNKELLEEVVGNFLDIADTQVQTLRDALEKQDIETLRHELHKIHGGAANLAAIPLVAAAESMSKFVRAGQLHRAGEQLTEIEKELERLKVFA